MLKELIDQFYLDNQKNKEQTRFYITDAGKCPRAVFFKFKNVAKSPMDARILRIFEHGENIHRSIFNVLYRLRIGVVTEVSIPSQEIISGRAPEERGNGLKYVKFIISKNPINLFFQTGNAILNLNANSSDLKISKALDNFHGCLVLIKW